MPPKKGAALYDPKKEYADRSKSNETDFAEFEIYSKSPKTVILLLRSDENEIVLRSLHHLDKFAKIAPKNVQALHTLQIVETVLSHKLAEHEELFIKRFALKLIADVFHKTVVNFGNEATFEIFEMARRYYIQDEDNFVAEYSAMILLKLINEPRLSAMLQEDMELISEGLYKRIENTDDPDILYHSYKILMNTFAENPFLDSFCALESFPFERILSEINNQFLEIQTLSLQILAEVSLCKDDFFLSRFCCKRFFEEWFQAIEKLESVGCHQAAVALGQRLMRHPKIARLFIMQFMSRFNVFSTNTKFIQEGIRIYYELTIYPEAWQYMFDTGIVDQLRKHLADRENASFEVCACLVKLMSHNESFEALMKSNPVPDFLSVLKDSQKDWKTRGAAAEALTTLCKRSLDASNTTIANNIGSILAYFLNMKYGKIPPEVLVNILNLLNSLAKDEDTQNQLMTTDLAGALVSAIKNSARSSVMVTNLFNSACLSANNQVFRDELIHEEFWVTTLKYLKSKSIIVKNSAAEFVMLTGKSAEFADYYIDEGTLECLLGDDSSLICCSNWSAAIENILSTNLSLKFSVRGKLDFTDITTQNFFVSKHTWKNIKTFRAMIKEEVSPRHTLFLVNFNHETCSAGEIVHFPKSKEDGKSFLTDDDCTYCRKPNDPYLPKYFEKAQRRLEDHGLFTVSSQRGIINVGQMTNRAKILANLVHEEMCGTRSGQHDEVCTEQTVLNHLNFWKHTFHCNIIPLGQVRYGGYFERAILYKTLADQTGLPCTLQRGEDGKTLWNEIPIPTCEDEHYCEGFMNLPTRLLRPTHIVDLMDKPGELYPVGSRDGIEYLRLV